MLHPFCDIVHDLSPLFLQRRCHFRQHSIRSRTLFLVDFRQFVHTLLWILLCGKGVVLPILVVDGPRGYLLSPLHLS